MFYKEKLIIRLHQFLRNIAFHFIFWEFAFLFLIFISPNNYLYQSHLTYQYELSFGLFLLTYSFSIAVIIAFIDLLFSDKIYRFLPMRLTLLFKSILNFALALSFIALAEPRIVDSLRNNQLDVILESSRWENPELIRFLVYFYLLLFLNHFFADTYKRIGSGNFSRWISGVLKRPNEEERIFMFIDLKSSTTYAEQLGHKKFSYLIQDLFNDLAIVDNYGGEIYQYLGDGAIISWKVKHGLAKNDCLRAYFAFIQLVEDRKKYYLRKFKVEPKFKAGLHVGKVMVLQVGQIRRDISYNGDSINTAARIESKCNELKQDLLISAALFNMMTDTKPFRFKSVGEIPLRGKSNAVEIIAVKLKTF